MTTYGYRGRTIMVVKVGVASHLIRLVRKLVLTVTFRVSVKFRLSSHFQLSLRHLINLFRFGLEVDKSELTEIMEEKVILVTGANSGIGAGIVRYLVRIGYRKLAILARRESMLKQVANDCEGSAPCDILILPKNLMDESACLQAVQETVDHFGRLDVVISNAGGGSGAAKVRDKDVSDFRHTLDLNVIAPFLITKAALPHLEKTKGNILYVSSIAATQTVHNYSDYCAAKAALNHFAKNVASEEAGKGVRANVLAPGVIVTEGQTKGNSSEQAFDVVRQNLRKYQPLGRVGEIVEMAKLAAFIISDDNRFMTGSIITSDGGVCVDYKASL